MTALVILLFVLIVAAVVVNDQEGRDQLARERLRRRVKQADQAVGDAAQQARREMNEAAGQSWRNRFE